MKPPPRKKREIFLENIHQLAIDCWLNKATRPEPEKPRRQSTATRDGDETLPSRLQTMTNDEAYEKFQEHYTEQVLVAMKERSDTLRKKYKANTEYNRQVLDRLDKQENWFPGKLWFLGKKPAETKLNQEHTTGLCKDCHSTQVNYTSLLRYHKQRCHCRTVRCPNWICLCEDEVDCSCNPVCCCDDCMSCQVGYF